MQKWAAFSVAICAAAILLNGQARKGYSPKEGFVPDEKTAIAEAEAILAPIYGEKQVASERPYTARLNGGVWIVQGSLPDEDVGGVAEIQIRKADAAVMLVSHGK
jgi:hypothetical protein